ncbi:MAG: AAA family ATPase [Myxococcales bacterium]|nr:AAA family ATPase [Myxococcales bacterium]
MTLEEHFGFTQPPFPRVAPESALLRHQGLEEVLARLRFAMDRDTIAVLFADSGCGKSTALSLFARSLDAASHQLVTLSLTTLGPFGLLASISVALGLRPRRFKGETAAALLGHLRSLPKRTVLLIDEAHLLPDASLEDLRLLTADDFDRKSPFALILAGQPLLRDRLAEPAHWALSQRVGVRIRLRPLTEAEVAAFLDRHLKAAGAKKPLFDPAAVAAIFQHSRGIPRLVQNIALASALAAMAAGAKTIDQAKVQQAVVDMEDL